MPDGGGWKVGEVGGSVCVSLYVPVWYGITVSLPSLSASLLLQARPSCLSLNAEGCRLSVLFLQLSVLWLHSLFVFLSQLVSLPGLCHFRDPV